ncbi:MAG: acyl-protein synthetase [Oscillospiraceae bacterium]|nr:acyl-protein synthetase [Oscillospiraceae bacterium]
MSYTKKLFRLKAPFDTEQSNELFLKAVRENCEYHYKNCPEYKQILDGAGFSPEDLKEYRDIERLPFIPTLFFKKNRLYSMPERKMFIHATSSGTSGRFSDIGFDLGGLLCGLDMVITVAKRWKLLSPVPCNYIILGYRPHRSNKTAVAKTAYGYTLFSPALSRTFALKYKDGKYFPDLDGIANSIVRHSKSRFPLRFIGFPSYTYFVMKLMEERGIAVQLPKRSLIMLGGGWKQFYKEQADKGEFYALAKKVLGIDEENIIEAFGAAEHPILYCDCEKHHFHVPVYSRVIIRDVHTLEPVPDKQIGLVNLITPMVKATPILSIMTDDLGILHDGSECGCGIESPYLEIIGRVGLRDIKTCAAGAAEILSAASTDKEVQK